MSSFFITQSRVSGTEKIRAEHPWPLEVGTRPICSPLTAWVQHWNVMAPSVICHLLTHSPTAYELSRSRKFAFKTCQLEHCDILFLSTPPPQWWKKENASWLIRSFSHWQLKHTSCCPSCSKLMLSPLYVCKSSQWPHGADQNADFCFKYLLVLLFIKARATTRPINLSSLLLWLFEKMAVSRIFLTYR